MKMKLYNAIFLASALFFIQGANGSQSRWTYDNTNAIAKNIIRQIGLIHSIQDLPPFSQYKQNMNNSANFFKLSTNVQIYQNQLKRIQDVYNNKLMQLKGLQQPPQSPRMSQKQAVMPKKEFNKEVDAVVKLAKRLRTQNKEIKGLLKYNTEKWENRGILKNEIQRAIKFIRQSSFPPIPENKKGAFIGGINNIINNLKTMSFSKKDLIEGVLNQADDENIPKNHPLVIEQLQRVMKAYQNKLNPPRIRRPKLQAPFSTTPHTYPTGQENKGFGDDWD